MQPSGVRPDAKDCQINHAIRPQSMRTDVSCSSQTFEKYLNNWRCKMQPSVVRPDAKDCKINYFIITKDVSERLTTEITKCKFQRL